MCLARVSFVCPGPPGEGQDGLQRPLRHRPGGQDQEEDQDHLWEPEPRLGGELQLVSQNANQIEKGFSVL